MIIYFYSNIKYFIERSFNILHICHNDDETMRTNHFIFSPFVLDICIEDKSYAQLHDRASIQIATRVKTLWCGYLYLGFVDQS